MEIVTILNILLNYKIIINRNKINIVFFLLFETWYELGLILSGTYRKYQFQDIDINTVQNYCMFLAGSIDRYFEET